MVHEGVDGPYNWMIAGLCCIMTFLMVGTVKIFGLLFVESLSHFNINRKLASLPFIVFSITRSCGGPVAGYFAHKFGLRPAMLSGGVLSAFGVGACFFATDISTICILWGGLFGIGCALIMAFIPQIIHINFKKHFVKGFGLTCCGASLAGIFLSPAVAVLLQTFGLSGTFLILGAIILHSIPIALLLGNPKGIQNVKYKLKNSTKKPTKKEMVNERMLISSINSSSKNSENESSTSHKPFLDLNQSHYRKQNIKEIKDSEIVLNLKTISGSANRLELSSDIQKLEVFSNDPLYKPDSEKTDMENRDVFAIQDVLPKTGELNRKIYSTLEVPYSQTFKGNDSSFPIQHSSFDHTKSESHPIIASQRTVQNAPSSHPFKVFCNISYLLVAFNFGSALFFVSFYNSVCVDIVMDKGILKSEATNFLIALNVLDLFCKVSLGWITDGGYMTRANLSATCFFLSAVSALFIAFSNGFVTLMISICLQGLCVGSIVATVPGIIPQYVEKDQQTMAMASAPFFIVPLSASTPALIGYFRDYMGYYNSLMYFLSALATINGIFLLILPHVEKWRKKKL